MAEIDSLLSKVLDYRQGQPFYRFSNADGKMWMIPIRDIRIGMNLYQPGGRNGKLLKNGLPILHRIPQVRKFLHIESVRCELKEDLKKLLCRLFHIDDFQFSLFCGAPSATQKIIIQLSRGNEIIGYCKLTDNTDVKKLFNQETETLLFLHEKGITNIPFPLYCDEYEPGIRAFVQTTEKTSASVIVHHWTEGHRQFLDRLYETTKTITAFEQTDYYRYIEYLSSHLHFVPATDTEHIRKSIDFVKGVYSSRQDFSAFHGDFTPWNMFMEQKKLFVFDWECAERTFPPRMDAIHYILQTALLEKHLDRDASYRYLQEQIHTHFEDSVGMYRLTIAYLLYIIAYYFMLYGKEYDITEPNYMTRIGILKKLTAQFKLENA